MDYKAVSEILVDIESKFDTGSMLYRGFNVWPLVRSYISSHFLNPNKKHVKKRLRISIEWRFELVYRISRAIYYNQIYKKILAENKKLLNQTGEPPIVFFSRAEDHSDQTKGMRINRHLDPLIEISKEKYNYIKIENLSNEGCNTNPRIYPATLINLDYLCITERIKDLLLSFKRRCRIKYFADFKRLIRHKEFASDLNEEFITRQADIILEYEQAFLKILKPLRPRAVFLVCFYYPIAMALIKACKRLNVITIDIQHGKQGKYHTMYTHWSRIPEGGYKLLPDFFWVWGEETRQNMMEWLPHNCRHHLPIIGGNVWLSQWIKDNKYEQIGRKESKLISILSKYEKRILFTLQPLKEPIFLHLWEAMIKSPKNWIWLIRVHPMQRVKISDIKDEFAQKGISNYEIDISSHIFLYTILKRVDYHITGFSSVCYESLYFGVPTTIVHSSGYQLYAEYIKRGIFTFADSGEDLINRISMGHSKENLKEEIPYIETDLAKAKRAMDNIAK